MKDTKKVEFIESYIKIGDSDYKWNDNHGELIRCKDCRHWYPLTKTCNNVDGACCQSYVADDWFCANGERKDSD